MENLVKRLLAIDRLNVFSWLFTEFRATEHVHWHFENLGKLGCNLDSGMK